ncbi:MAG: baseplate tail-tube junction protein, partial [Candidatus Dormibacteria bacterium]
GFTQLALRSAGLALNPQVEVLFTGTRNRQFQFEFQFQARSQQEALTILQIINTFKKYAAPSLAKGNAGRYFIVPGQFDIQFKFKNDNNPYIGKISTCVLFNIAVNYVGAGQWATFSDGSPVHINLQLQFMETDIIYSELIDQKGY